MQQRRDMIEIIYSGPVCPLNQKYINRRFCLSKRYREAKESLILAARGAARSKKAYRGDVFVYIDFHYPRAVDIDSFLKFILDSLQGIFYVNDKQIKCLTVYNRGKGPSRFLIRVYEDYDEAKD